MRRSEDFYWAIAGVGTAEMRLQLEPLTLLFMVGVRFLCSIYYNSFSTQIEGGS